MKSIYTSVCSILYPKYAFGRAGAQFAEGTHPYAKDNRYPPHLCQALMDFEQSNRGHRHLLGAPTLRVDSVAAIVDYDDRNLIKVRRTMRNSLRNLFRSVLALEWESPEGDFQGLLDSYDRLGYMPSIVFDEIKFACKAAHLTWLPAWLEVTAVRVETGEDAVVHLRINRTWDNASAKRSIPLVQLDRISLREAKIFYKDSVHRVREALKDAVHWPEFAAAEVQESSVSTHSLEERARISELAGRVLVAAVPTGSLETVFFSGPAEQVQLGGQVAEVLDAPPVQGTLPGLPPAQTVHVFVLEDVPGSQVDLATALPTKIATLTVEGALTEEAVDAALLERLKRHVHGFVSRYSPDMQSLLAKNWEQFRPDVPVK